MKLDLNLLACARGHRRGRQCRTALVLFSNEVMQGIKCDPATSTMTITLALPDIGPSKGATALAVLQSTVSRAITLAHHAGMPRLRFG